MTEAQRRALTIVQDYCEKYRHPIRPREFSKLMWPDSEGHHHHTKCGNHGSTHGGGMWLAGGGYLGKLRHAGLLLYSGGSYDSGYMISAKGREALMEENPDE